MVKIDLLAEINIAVDAGLAKVSLPNTPHNRVMILSGMHQRLSSEGVKDSSDRSILQAIEDEILRLDDEDDRTS